MSDHPRLRLVTHNVWVGNRGDELRANLSRLAEDTSWPHAIAVQEATGLRLAIPGYQRVAVAVDELRHPDDLGCQLLLRDDVELVRRRLVPVGGPWWTGPKHGHRHPPKVFVGATVGWAGLRWDLLSVHRVWTGGMRRNMGAWAAEHEALAEWTRARAARADGHRPVVELGDWNGRTSDTGRLSVTGLAAQVDGKLTMRGIDGALAVNATVSGCRELERRYGSDGHHPLVMRLHPS